MQLRVASNGDIVVPRELAEKLGFRPGDLLDVYIEEGRIVIARHTEPSEESPAS